jgi:hypothetical protein
MKLFNPTQDTVQIGINGKTLRVKSNESVNVTEEEGTIWLKTHEFLKMVDEEIVTPEVVKTESKKEEVVEVDEIVVEKKEVKEAKEVKAKK